MERAGGEHTDDLRRLKELEDEIRALRERVGIFAPEASPSVAAVLGDARVLEMMPAFITITDRTHSLVYVNRVRRSYARSALIGMKVDAIVHPDDAAAVSALFAQVFRNGEVADVEFHSREGTLFDARLVPVHDGDEVAFVISIANDITDARKAELALRASEAEVRLAVRASGMGTWSWSFEVDAIELGENARLILGVGEDRESIKLDDYFDLIVEADRERVAKVFRNAIESGEFRDFEHRIRLPDGGERWLLSKGEIEHGSNGELCGMRGGILDVTDRYALEMRVREAQKMEAIGRLTSGIAHNFNNLLGVILPSVELARRASGEKLVSRLEDIEHASIRAAEMVRELMLFARGAGKLELRLVDPVELVERTVSICRATFGSEIAIGMHSTGKVPPIPAHANQLEQVLLNILLNARDALEEEKRANPRIDVYVGVENEGRVAIRIEDNGPGMDECVRAQVFEPFFSTKGSGHGTGLGLSSAYAIVQEHGGRIECASRPGQGTAFRIELPLGTAPLPKLSTSPLLRPVSGDERILVVDDEIRLRDVLRGVLEESGYSVEDVESGEVALARVSAGVDAFDLILLDHAMPGISGDALLEELAQHTSAKLVVLTGDTSRVRGERASAILSKPVSSARLLAAVREVLDGTA